MFQDSPGAMDLRTAPGSSLVLQIDKGTGRYFLLILWLSAFFSALAVIGLLVAYTGYRQMTAHVNVLQYDLAQVKAQLIERGLYEPTSH
jgi:glutaminase